MHVFFFQAEDGIRDYKVTGVQTCALPIWDRPPGLSAFFVGQPMMAASRLSAGGGADPLVCAGPPGPTRRAQLAAGGRSVCGCCYVGRASANATRFSNIGNSCGSCGADLQVCAGSPGPALRATESAISEHEEAGVDVGRRTGGVLPHE